ncbi:MAG: hypothetical protein Q7S72_01290 [Candidatus Taylorbacteria bacterium]|nr:hypothetical protein [Candidatus Taylorbacteria bacterium]
MKKIKNKRPCLHDYQNTVEVENIGHFCPFCDELLDPQDIFFYTYFESLGVKFIDVTKY